MTKIKNIQKRKITQKALHRLELLFLQNRKKAEAQTFVL